MKKTVLAYLKWGNPEEGGRQLPPLGPTYSTVARFESQKELWSKEAWSLVIEFIEPPNNALCHRVRVNFLAEGPEELLQPGSVFELMEGRKPVARGTVTG